MSLIHISFGGPVYELHAIKKFRFEDHPYCGPIVQHKGVCQWKAEIPTVRWVFDLGVTT